MSRICRVVVSERDRASCKEPNDSDWRGLDTELISWKKSNAWNITFNLEIDMDNHYHHRHKYQENIWRVF